MEVMGGWGAPLTLQEPKPLTPPMLLCAALPFVIQSIIFDQNCQLHSCHTLPVCVCVCQCVCVSECVC